MPPGTTCRNSSAIAGHVTACRQSALAISRTNIHEQVRAIARNANVCSISRVRSTEKCVLRQEARRVATNQCGEASIARNANVCSISGVRSTEKCVLRQEARRVATNQCGEASIARNANVCSISRVRSTEKCVLRQEAGRVATISWK